MHLLCSGMKISYLEKFYLLGLVIRFVWTLFGGVLRIGLIIIEVRLHCSLPGLYESCISPLSSL